MEVGDETKQINDINIHKNSVHKILAHSYLFYFIVFLFSLFLDYIFPLKFFENSYVMWIGALFLIFGTFLIFWAQKSSHNFKKEIINKEIFCNGPYCYTRTPTHFGLFLLILGFGMINNALFIIIFSIISFIITKFIFIKKEEEILSLKYGTPYLEYKKSVRF
ncbi:MAG: methyltransferase [Candidatus Paceibacterota bacterium]